MRRFGLRVEGRSAGREAGGVARHLGRTGRPGRGSRLVGTVAVLALVAGLLGGLAPRPARANDYGPPGLGGAQIDVDPDGYDRLPAFGSLPTQVSGKQFKPSDVAQIFECADDAVDLHSQCQPLGTSPTDASGGFGPVEVVAYQGFARPSEPGSLVPCRGLADQTQCAVVAATFAPGTLEPTSRADHLICFVLGADSTPCKPKPTVGGTTTTSSSTTSTTTSTTTPASTTSTTLPAPAACKQRESVVQDDLNQDYDPFVNGQSGGGSDVLWQEQSPTSRPPARQRHGMAYDPNTKQTVLFGGFSSSAPGCVLGDTWIWDGTAWHQALGPDGNPVAGPSPRYHHAMAYDGTGIVVFGGYDGFGDLGDTWTWDGSRWQRQCRAGASTTGTCAGLSGDVAGPSPRSGAAMSDDAGDPATPDDDRAVLFGGDQAIDGHGKVLGDTWTWDGRAKHWAQQAPAFSPMPRAFAQMGYRPGSGVVLEGGWNGLRPGYGVGIPPYDEPLRGTFTWDRITWTPRQWGPQTYGAAIAYHPATGLLVLHHGRQGISGAPEATYDGGGWDFCVSGAFGCAQGTATAAGPPQRDFPAMAQDAQGHLVLFGGYGHLGREDQALAPGPDPLCDNQTGTCLPAGGRLNDNAERGDTWTLATPGSTSVPVGSTGVTIEVNPHELAPDGVSTAQVTVTVGEPGAQVSLRTDGDVTFAQPSGTTGADGRFTTTLTASKTPGIETITADYTSLIKRETGTYGSVSTTLVEKGMTLSLDPASISADGHSTSVATAKVYKEGLVDEQVCFATDGDVTVSAPGPGHCGTKVDANTWRTTITASNTADVEQITAKGSVSGFTATAELVEGGGSWVDRSPAVSGPAPGRENAAVAYDEASGLTVLFGGYLSDHERIGNDPAAVLGDTWVWDATQWTQLSVPGPSAREGAAMTYDASSRKLILFGGHDGTDYLGDTWSFDGATRTWTELHPASAPSPRYVANMASDGTGAVLFSGTAGWAYDTRTGSTDPDGPGRLHDTWEWRDGAWTNVTPAPPVPPATAPPTRFTNTSPVVVALPPPPAGCPGVHCDPDKANPYPSKIAVSGVTGKVASVTATLHDLSWTQAGPADADIMLVGPQGRSVMLMSDACSTDTSPNPIPSDHPVTLTFDDAAPGPLPSDCRFPDSTARTYRPTNVAAPECTPWHTPDYFPPPAPGRADGSALNALTGADPNGTWSLYAVDDCPDNPNPAGEAGRIAGGWTIDIATTDAPVAPPAPVTSPPGRGRGAIAYDPPSGKVVLFGGTQEYQPDQDKFYGSRSTFGEPFRALGDTWTWDPGTRTWAQQGTGTHPGERRSAVMADHSSTGRLVLFGGSATRIGRVADPDGRPECRQKTGSNWQTICSQKPTWLNDTWTWDGESWAPQAPPISPPGDYPAGMGADAGGHDVLVAGMGGTARTWTWQPQVTLRAAPQVVPADGRTTSTVTARVVDAAGNGVPGLAVTFGTDGDVSFSGVSDHRDGTYTATITASPTGDIETLTVRTPHGSASATLNEVPAPSGPCPATGQPGSWTSVAPMPTARGAVSGATGGDGRIYAFGGHLERDESNPVYGPVVSTAEVFDPCTNSWQSLPPMPGGARAAAGAAGPDGRIYVVGGRRSVSVMTDLVEVYTPGSGSTPGRWQTLPPLPVVEASHAIAVDHRGTVYVTGGYSYLGGNAQPYQSTVQVYSPATDTWSVQQMPEGRMGHGSAVGPDGRVFVVGGYLIGDQPVNSGNAFTAGQPYDPATGRWDPIAPMSIGRAQFGMATGPDGLIYAAGGGVSGETVEAYSGCSGGWVPVASMGSRRYEHAVVTGRDGRVYALGGYAGSTDPASAANYSSVTAGVEAYTVDPQLSGSLCPKVSINDVTVTEPSSGSAPATFTVTLDRPSAEPVEVDYHTVDGTATAGSDYTATSGRLVFGPGQVTKTVPATTVPPTTVPGALPTPLGGGGGGAPPPDPSQAAPVQTISVPVLADKVVEPTETFTLRLSLPAPGTATLAKGEGTATILDAAPPALTPTTVTPTTLPRGPVPTTTTTTTSLIPVISVPPVPQVHPPLRDTTTPPTTAAPVPTTTATTQTTVPETTTTTGPPTTTTTGPTTTTTSPPPPPGAIPATVGPPPAQSQPAPPAPRREPDPLHPVADQSEPSPPSPVSQVTPVLLPLVQPGPPPPPATLSQSISESQAQSQAQAQQQVQSQAQQQAQQQSQAQAQQQVQAAAQPGMMEERERQAQAQRAHATETGNQGGSQTHMASARRRPAGVPPAALAWVASLAALGMGLLSRNGERAPAPQPLRNVAPGLTSPRQRRPRRRDGPR